MASEGRATDRQGGTRLCRNCVTALSARISSSSLCDEVPARRSRLLPCSRATRSRGSGFCASGRSDFRDACRNAAETAAQGHIVTFGIHPTHAVTNYGYIRAGRPLNGACVPEVEAFIERPGPETASQYVCGPLSMEQRQFPVSCCDHVEGN